MLSQDQNGIFSKVTDSPADWRALLFNSPEQIDRVLAETGRIAVIGMKTPEAGGPAYSVPAWLEQVGYTIIPVPVYYPEVTSILGKPVHRSLATITPPPDIVLLFRRSGDVSRHVEEILAAKPAVVWMQLGIQNEAAAESFARAGIVVVQDKCMQNELMRRSHPIRATTFSRDFGLQP